jgi:hypothetical protein
MAERYEGEEQLLSEAVGRVVHIRPRKTGRKKGQQYQVTIPAAIARLMLKKSEAWRWKLTDEGVLLEPATEEDPNALPAWAHQAERQRRRDRGRRAP